MIFSNPDAVQVAVRVKPLSEHERDTDVRQCVRIVDRQIDVRGQRTYAFDHVYGPGVETDRLFHGLIEPLINSAFLSGYNATVFAYGQTGAGKTYTMNGVTRLAVHRICQFVRDASEHDAFAARDGDDGDGTSAKSNIVSTCCFNLRAIPMCSGGMDDDS